MAQASDACRLTGLTQHQLREWCVRRGVVRPDVPPAGPGRHALYSWQTLLALRLLREIHEQFGVEVSAWSTAITSLISQLQGRSFPSLWGLAAQFPSANEASIIGSREGTHQGLTLAFDPHLEVLASALSLPGPPYQLPLFPVLAVQP